MIKQDKKLQAQLFNNQQKRKDQKILSTQAQLIKPQGEVDVDLSDDRALLKYSQEELKDNIPVANAQNVFQILIEKGPFHLSANTQNVFLGGSSGHIAMFDWKQKELMCEFEVNHKVNDIHWLAQNNFAVAQDDAVYMYDSKGTELHKMRDHKHPLYLEYLPYHYLLASVNKFGRLTYQDITQGQIVINYKTTSTPKCMIQNPHNAAIAIGDALGVARLYTPNSGTAAMSILCHKSSLNALSFTRDGNYMITGGGEGVVKVWDLRTCKSLGAGVNMPQQIGRVSVSQMGVIAATTGRQITLFKDLISEGSYKPYMKHLCQSTIAGLEFIDHEDYLAVTTQTSYVSIIVPQSGDPNFDTYESLQHQTKKQRAESHVRSLLEKLPPSTIHINPNLIGTIDRASKDVIEKENKIISDAKDDKRQKKIKKKMRGRGSVKNKFLNKEAERSEEQQLKWQSSLSESMRVRKAEKSKRKHEQSMLSQLEDLSAKQFIKAVTKKPLQEEN